MTTERRVARLKEMVARIERLPPSPERDRLVYELRSRVVDLDTGVTPQAIFPPREPAPVPNPRKTSKRNMATNAKRTAPVRPPPAVEHAPLTSPSRLQSGEVPYPSGSEDLSLEDPLQLAPLPDVSGRGGRAVPPWTRGLRG
jgi:hypothetical protein